VQEKFIKHIKQVPDYAQKKYLLAVSGGIDSVVLAHLLHQNKLNFEMAHCNFALRGDESNQDEEFVKKLAKQLDVPLHIKKCPVNTKENTQLAARNQRYEWFNKLKHTRHFDYILTAHHLNDAIETFFINLLRGTGIQGLLGIPENETYLRPLLDISREEIHKYAKEKQLQWREDSSNASVKYLRNKIRHNLIPEIKKISPEFELIMQRTFKHLQETNGIVLDWFEGHKKEIIKEKNEEQILDIEKWKNLKNKNRFLFQWLKNYGFSDWESIYQLPFAQSGKYHQSGNHLLLKHNNQLILSQKPASLKNDSYIFNSIPEQIQEPFAAKFEILHENQISLDEIKKAGKNILFIDFDKLNFPLIIRKKRDGDYFYPLGMKGKKKLSDFYKDEKISMTEKEKIWLFCDNKNIVWVSGKRPDDRYKINAKTKKILKITLL